MSSASDFGLDMLGVVLKAIPGLVPIIARGLEGDDSPLAAQVRARLPEDGASAAARRELEERSRP